MIEEVGKRTTVHNLQRKGKKRESKDETVHLDNLVIRS